MEFFSTDESVIADICEALTQAGCCSRCILRYAGLKDMYTFRGDTEEMNQLVSKLRSKNVKVAEELDIIRAVDGAETADEEAKADQSGPEPDEAKAMEVTEDGAACDGLLNQDISVSDIGVASTDKLENGTAETVNCKAKDASTTQTEGTSASKTQTEALLQCYEVTSTCVVCLGILEQFTAEDFLNKIKSEVTRNGFVYSTYFCSLMLPVCVSLREHALILFLKEKFLSVYGEKKYTDIATVKDVWKWKNGPVLKTVLEAPFDTKSPFEVTLTFSYKNSDKECNFLLSSGLDTFRQRKMDRRHRRKASFAVFTRANVASAIDKMAEEEFKKSYTCPPAAPSCTTVCDIKCQNEAVFVAGRYNKYSRKLSQTPWVIEGVRKSESSVEELLCQEINKNFKPKEVRFSSSGREDVDVLMLGDGRPFVLELINPCRRDFSQEELNCMQKIVNSSTKDIACGDLQIVTREDVDVLKEGEIDKVKQYRALCWTQDPVTDDQLVDLSAIKDLKILQKTPIRVLHRRPLSTRDKIVHSMSASRVDSHHFSVDLSTQAGTYIKEFVHGDLGRTKPNFSTLLGTDCDILELDVTAVELDWPKKIQTTVEDQNG